MEYSIFMPIMRYPSRDAHREMPITRCPSRDAHHEMPITRCPSRDAHLMRCSSLPLTSSSTSNSFTMFSWSLIPLTALISLCKVLKSTLAANILTATLSPLVYEGTERQGTDEAQSGTMERRGGRESVGELRGRRREEKGEE